MRSYVICALVVLIGGTSVLADTLVLRDGRTFTGKLVRQNDKEVTFNARVGSATATVKFPIAQVEKIVEEDEAPAVVAAQPVADTKPAGPAYFVIPIHGEFGTEITSKVFANCLKLAQSNEPVAVILEIDSGGGRVDTLMAMLEELDKYPKLRMVAYVKNAYSAAAILAMSCKEIVMAPSAAIGATVVFTDGPDGTPRNISEKWESASRAKFTSVAERAGHDPLLVQGMMRMDIVLGLEEKEGKVRIVEGKTDEPLKDRNRILTLTAKQAVRCGLSAGMAQTVDDVDEALGKDGWAEGRASARPMFDKWKADLKQAATDFEQALKGARTNYTSALASDPRRFTYIVTPGGEFTTSSRREWQQRTDKCKRHLQAAEGQLGRAENIAKEYPEASLDPIGALGEIKASIAALRQAIEADRNRRGLGG